MLNQNALFDALMEQGSGHDLVLMGSRAMGMLHLEKGYRSWGAEMSTEITPHAASLDRFCSTTKDYIGRPAVDAERTTPPARRLITIEVDPAAPPCWGTEPILRSGELIGHVTSGGMGWRTGNMLAVGWTGNVPIGTDNKLEIQILQKNYIASALTDPVYDPNNQTLQG